METERQELNGAFEWMNRGGKESSQRKGCGCLLLGWVLVIGGGLAYLAAKGQFVIFGESGFVGIGFALGVGLCFIIFGSLWVRIRELIRKLLGKGSSKSKTSSSDTTTTSRRTGFPSQNNQSWTRQSSRQSNSNQSATGIPNPWDTKQNRFFSSTEGESSYHYEETAETSETTEKKDTDVIHE